MAFILNYTGLMMNFRLSQLLMAFALLLWLAACTPPTPPPSPTPPPTPSPQPTQTTAAISQEAAPSPSATLTPRPSATPAAPALRPTAVSSTTLTVWQNLPAAQEQQLRRDIEGFQASFPQYQVNLQRYSSPESFMTPLTAGQIEFDIILAPQTLLSNLWTAEQIAPMSDFFPPSFVDSFAANTLQGASRDELLWGLPDTTGFHLLLFYNKKLVDTPPTTTADMIRLAETMREGSRWGLGVNSYDPLWLLPWLTPYGGWLVDDAGQPSLNTPAMEAALALYLAWQDQDEGAAPVETYNRTRDRFLAGNVGMMIDGEWAIAELDRANRIDWGVAVLPTVDGEEGPQPAAPLILGRYWAVGHGVTGDQALAAAAFLEFMTQPERQLTWATAFNLLPTRREALDSPMIINDPVWRVNATQMRAGRALPLGTNANFLLDAMREPLQAALDGELAPADAVARMQANTED